MRKLVFTLLFIILCFFYFSQLAYANDGNVYWTTNGVSIRNSVSQAVATLSDGAGGALIACRGNYGYLYAQRIDGDGNAKWTTNGVAICTAGYTTPFYSYLRDPRMTSDGAGGAIITWTDNRDSNEDIYVQRVDANGNLYWSSNGVVLCNASGDQRFPRISSDGNNGAIVTWQDQRAGNWDIYAQRIDSTGTVQWTSNGVPICTQTNEQDWPVTAETGSGGAFIFWEDNRGGSYLIYGQLINSSGTVQWAADGIGFVSGAPQALYPETTYSNNGQAIVTWRDNRANTAGIHAQKVDSNGTAQWTTDGVALSNLNSANQTLQQIAPDGAGGAVVVWEDGASGFYNIYAQKIDADGNLQWAQSAVTVSTGLNLATPHPRLISDGNNGCILAWEDTRSGASARQVAVQAISSEGNIRWTTNGMIICSFEAVHDNVYPDIASDGKGGGIVSWSDERVAHSYGLYAQRVEGRSVWYFAEGSTSGTFEEWLTVQNPTEDTADVTFTFMKTDSSTVTYTTSITSHKRYTLDVSSVSGLSSADVSVKIESTNGVRIIAERSMYWNDRQAGHNTIGATMPNTVWYLAEGSSRTGYEQWVTVQNPQSVDATIEITAMTADASTVIYQGTLQQTKRFSYDPAADVGEGKDYSLKIRSSNGIAVVAERTVYWNDRQGGHNTIAITSPSLSWYFAEGTTRSPYQEWLTIQNPNNAAAEITVTFMKADSSTVSQTASIEGGRRYTMDVNSVLGAGADNSVEITATNGIGIIAERPMYWNDSQEGHITLGTAAPAVTWYFAEGTTRPGFEEWLTVGNPSSQTAQVTFTFMKDDGTTVTQEATIAGTKRYTLDAGSVSGLDNADISVKIESTNNVGIIAERSMYWSDRRGGHNTIGVRE